MDKITESSRTNKTHSAIIDPSLTQVCCNSLGCRWTFCGCIARVLLYVLKILFSDTVLLCDDKWLFVLKIYFRSHIFFFCSESLVLPHINLKKKSEFHYQMACCYISLISFFVVVAFFFSKIWIGYLSAVCIGVMTTFIRLMLKWANCILSFTHLYFTLSFWISLDGLEFGEKTVKKYSSGSSKPITCPPPFQLKPLNLVQLFFLCRLSFSKMYPRQIVSWRSVSYVIKLNGVLIFDFE